MLFGVLVKDIKETECCKCKDHGSNAKKVYSHTLKTQVKIRLLLNESLNLNQKVRRLGEETSNEVQSPF